MEIKILDVITQTLKILTSITKKNNITKTPRHSGGTPSTGCGSKEVEHVPTWWSCSTKSSRSEPHSKIGSPYTGSWKVEYQKGDKVTCGDVIENSGYTLQVRPDTRTSIQCRAIGLHLHLPWRSWCYNNGVLLRIGRWHQVLEVCCYNDIIITVASDDIRKERKELQYLV